MLAFAENLSINMKENMLKSDDLAKQQIDLDKKIRRVEKNAIKSNKLMSSTYKFIQVENGNVIKNMTRLNDKLVEHESSLNAVLFKGDQSWTSFLKDFGVYHQLLIVIAFISLIGNFLKSSSKSLVAISIVIMLLVENYFVKLVSQGIFGQLQALLPQKFDLFLITIQRSLNCIFITKIWQSAKPNPKSDKVIVINDIQNSSVKRLLNSFIKSRQNGNKSK